MPQENTYPCPCCKGSGQIERDDKGRDAMYDPCPICKGTGELRVTDAEE